jgi:hypothetical protein
VDGGVGMLDEPGQEAYEHCARLRLLKTIDEDLDSLVGGDFSEVCAAYAVSYGKEIAVGAGLLARCGNEEAHGVFIVGTNLAWVGCLAELNFQHGRCRLEGFGSAGLRRGRRNRL